MLGRRELELERRRRWRSSSGSLGERPLARANKFRTSVKLTTPVRRPLMFCPGRTAALTAAPGPMPVIDDPGELCVGSSRACGRGWTCEPERWDVGWKPGLGGTEPAGDGLSTIHMRWERVATSFATVWARVLTGVTWKTGYESWPSFRPRSERMIEMKWMHVSVRSGMEELSVSSCVDHTSMVVTRGRTGR
jgi:hypothetical protein